MKFNVYNVTTNENTAKMDLIVKVSKVFTYIMESLIILQGVLVIIFCVVPPIYLSVVFITSTYLSYKFLEYGTKLLQRMYDEEIGE